MLLGGNTGNEFGINYCGGQIFMQLANLSYHAQNQYILSVAAQSNGLSTSQTIANITVNVLNVPHYPVFNSTSCALSVAENSPVGTLVGSRIAAYDVDGRNITYFISAVSQGAVYLTIGPSTGAKWFSVPVFVFEVQFS